MFTILITHAVECSNVIEFKFFIWGIFSKHEI